MDVNGFFSPFRLTVKLH